MNYLEYGQTIRANLDEDISGATSYKILLTPQLGTQLEKTATLGTSNITEGDESWVANEYVEYVIQEDDLSYVGQWTKQAIALSSTYKKVGNIERFTVSQ